MPDANPYSSPQAEAASAEPTSERLPLGKLLLGLLVVPPVVAAANVALLPVGWVVEQLTTYFLMSSRFVTFSTGLYVTFDQVVSLLMFGAINVGFGLPLILGGWYKRSVTPRSVLQAGGLGAALWWIGLTGVMTYAMLQDEGMADGMGIDDVTRYPSGVVVVIQLAISLALFAPVPLFAGAAAYAWWVRRLLEKTALPGTDVS